MQSVISLQAHHVDTATESKDFAARGVDDAFLERAQFKFARKAPEYATGRDVWQALAKDQSLAVINAAAVPRRTDLGFAVGLPELQLQGLYYEDSTYDPVQVQVKDATTGKTRILSDFPAYRARHAWG